jgi:hypothetical protein
MEIINSEFEDVISSTLSSLSIYYRDANLSNEILNQYYIGQILKTDACIDVSHLSGSLIKNTRYVIFSSKAANFYKIEIAQNPFLSTINFNSYFKVLDVTITTNGKNYITLLHIPEKGLNIFGDLRNRFFVEGLSDKHLEEFLKEKAIEKIQEKQKEQQFTYLESDEWSVRTYWPIGFNIENNLIDLNECKELNDKQNQLFNLINKVISDNEINRKSDEVLEIKCPKTDVRIQVADHDFEYRMDWNRAKSVCNQLGNGWRLPSKQELRLMNDELHKKGHGNFNSEIYWSSTVSILNFVWAFHFRRGKPLLILKKSLVLHVRAVRDI